MRCCCQHCQQGALLLLPQWASNLHVAIAGGERARIAIATFDSTVQFYALRPGQAAPQMLVVPDVAEPYSPQVDALLVPARAACSLVSAL